MITRGGPFGPVRSVVYAEIEDRRVGIGLRQDGSISRIEITGCLADRCGDAELGQVVRNQLARGQRSFLLDLRNVTEVDSTGLAELTLVYKLVRERSARLELLCPSARLREVLRLSHLERLFPIHCDEQEAVDSLSA